MKEHPILFSGEIVRATREGRKTQTRRVMRPQPSMDFSPIAVERYHPVVIDKNGDEQPGKEIFGVYSDEEGYKCPYGQPGDLLWVREAWQPHPDAGGEWPEISIPSNAVCYAADYSPQDYLDSKPWKPSIHMPRCVSRITLEIVSVRVERVQEITALDAVAEGCSADRHATLEYHFLWEKLNGKRGFGWDVNPWVWVIEFKVVPNGS